MLYDLFITLLVLQTFEGRELVNLIKQLVAVDADWVPKATKDYPSSLYIRPTSIGIEVYPVNPYTRPTNNTLT